MIDHVEFSSHMQDVRISQHLSKMLFVEKFVEKSSAYISLSANIAFAIKRALSELDYIWT